MIASNIKQVPGTYAGDLRMIDRLLLMVQKRQTALATHGIELHLQDLLHPEGEEDGMQCEAEGGPIEGEAERGTAHLLRIPLAGIRPLRMRGMRSTCSPVAPVMTVACLFYDRG